MARRHPTCPRWALKAALLSLLTACSDAATGPQEMDLALALSFANSAGGEAAAFDKVDRASVVIAESETELFRTTAAVTGGGAVKEVRVRLDAELSGRTLFLEVELRMGDAPLFRGFGSFDFDATRSNEVEVELFPVIAGIALQDPVAELTQLGQRTQLEGEAVFASGDTVPDVPLFWTSLSPNILSVTPTGLATALSEGIARVRATVAGVTGESNVIVMRTVSFITIAPNPGLVPLGGTFPFTARAWDEQENPLSRTFTWSSSNAQIMQVNGNGVASGIAAGQALLMAAVGTVTESIAVTVAALPPPAAPSGLAAVTSATSVSLTWNDNATSETHYELWRRMGTGPSALLTTLPAGATTHKDETNTPDQAIEYTVRACNTVCSAFSNAFTARTVPVPPQALTFSPVGGNTVDLKWTDASALETSFIIERSVNGGSFVQVGTAAANATSLRVTGLTGTNAYTVRACNAAGCSTPSNTVTVMHTTPPPTATTLASQYNVELIGEADGLGVPFQAWFEWSYDTDFTEPFLTDVRLGAGPIETIIEPLQGLPIDQSIYYRFIVSNENGTSVGNVETFLTPEIVPQIYPDPMLCSSGPACVLNPTADTMYLNVVGPYGTFQNPFTRVYAEAASGSVRLPINDATVIVIDNAIANTRTYIYRIIWDVTGITPGFYFVEVFAERPSGGSVMGLTSPVTVTTS
jgi:hypothetical protein